MNAFVAKSVKKYFSDKLVLNGIDLSVGESEDIGIVGPSNSGKSTFLKILAGIYPLSSGSIEYGAEGLRPSTGFLFQEGGLFDGLTVIENVMFPLLSAKNDQGNELELISKSEAVERSTEILRRVGLLAALNKLPSELSGGMKKRVGIARALVSRPELLLLDDPTSGLDPITATSIMELISELEGDSKCTSITVSHDIRRLIPHVKRVVMFEDGLVVGDCLSADLQSNATEVMRNFLKTRFSFNNECQTS